MSGPHWAAEQQAGALCPATEVLSTGWRWSSLSQAMLPAVGHLTAWIYLFRWSLIPLLLCRFFTYQKPTFVPFTRLVKISSVLLHRLEICSIIAWGLWILVLLYLLIGLCYVFKHNFSDLAWTERFCWSLLYVNLKMLINQVLKITFWGGGGNMVTPGNSSWLLGEVGKSL